MANKPMAQLAFSWPAIPTYRWEDFIVSEANAQAVALVEHWPEASEAATTAPLAWLVGPACSGKTHLARHWKERVGGVDLSPAQLGTMGSEQLLGGARRAVMEDIEAVADESAFFHLLRHVELTHSCLLLTSSVEEAQLPFQRPDVKSRMAAAMKAQIQQPDEVLVQGFLTKAFADRQWRVAEPIIHYLVARTERTYFALQLLVQKLEMLILSTGRELTIPLIKPLVD